MKEEYDKLDNERIITFDSNDYIVDIDKDYLKFLKTGKIKNGTTEKDSKESS